MDNVTRGSFRLFQLAGIDVYLHWTWLLVAVIQINNRPEEYSVGSWKVVEYVSFFAIVLLHEFGHAFACRSVGGSADTIVLWPLGGIAYVAPPARPGAFLWSIVAGPLVNLVLVVPTFGMWYYADAAGWANTAPDWLLYISVLSRINLLLLIFNLIPIYPLDGGQILQALLWFGMDRWHSLFVVSAVGVGLGGMIFVGGMALFVLGAISGNGALAMFGGMLAMIAAFMVLRSLVSMQQARAVLTIQALPRHEEYACPNCRMNPPRGEFWVCEHCQTRFDLFENKGHCPSCGAWFLQPSCPHCYESSHIDRWRRVGTSSQLTAPMPAEHPQRENGEGEMV